MDLVSLLIILFSLALVLFLNFKYTQKLLLSCKVFHMVPLFSLNGALPFSFLPWPTSKVCGFLFQLSSHPLILELPRKLTPALSTLVLTLTSQKWTPLTKFSGLLYLVNAYYMPDTVGSTFHRLCLQGPGKFPLPLPSFFGRSNIQMTHRRKSNFNMSAQEFS